MYKLPAVVLSATVGAPGTEIGVNDSPLIDTSYNIYRGTSSGGENTFFTSTTNSFTDTGASGLNTPTGVSVAAGSNTAGTLSGSVANTYYYKVSALNSSGETLSSNEVSINGESFTPISVPGAPTVADSTTAGNLYTATTYCYEITAVTANGETTASSQGCADTNTDTSLTVSWTAVAGATSYNIYQDGGNGSCSGGCLLYASTTSTSYTDTGNGEASDIAPPSKNTATLNTNEAVISWSAVTGATSYKIYRSTQSGDENTFFSTTSTTFTDSGGSGTVVSV